MTRQDVFDYVKARYGTAPDDEIRNLIDMSFQLTASKRKRKKEKTDEHTDLWHEEVQ